MRVNINGHDREFSEPISLKVLLDEMDLNPRHVAVEVNTQLVPRAEHERYVLHDGDRLEIVTFVGGG